MKPRLLSLLLLAAAVIGCTDKSPIIRDNIENAKAQLAFLIETAEADSTLKIPSTFKNGKVGFVFIYFFAVDLNFLGKLYHVGAGANDLTHFHFLPSLQHLP